MSAKYKISSRSETIRENTTITPDGFCGWLAQNIGDNRAEVNGFVLEPLDKLDFHDMQPDCEWITSIIITFENGEGKLRLTRLQYSV